MPLDANTEVDMKIERRQFIALAGSLATVGSGRVLMAQSGQLVEPIHRVANAASATPPADVHPLDRGLEMAKRALHDSRTKVNDYTAVLVKRERVGDTLNPHEFMYVKVRNRKAAGGKISQPLSVYLKFVKPAAVSGREVIYVEGRNEGNLVAHEGGFKGRFLPTVNIPPTGMLAMRGQRYPLTEIGVENLIVKLIERGQRARTNPEVKCEFRKNARVQDRVCTMMQVTQPTHRPEAEFHQAQVFIDDELNLPIRYIAFDWPRQTGAEPEVIEEYNYLKLKLNVGLTDADFDPNNAEYNFYSK